MANGIETENKMLVPINLTPKDVFVPKGLDPILAGVRKKVVEFKKETLDMEKGKDRDKLRSFSADIARSKTWVDEKRKLFVQDKKAELKIIDQECKGFRDTMDIIKIETREPLTTWEDAEKVRIEKERQDEIYLMEWDDAIAIDDLKNREREVERKEAAFAKTAEDARLKEEAERLEKEQAERDERLKKEAAQEATDKLKRERIAAKDALEQAERDRIATEELAKFEKEKADREKIEAAEKAERDKQEAVKLAQRQAEERARLEKQAEEKKAAELKAAADKKAANTRHMAHVNNKILTALTDLGITKEHGKKIIVAVASGKIPEMVIRY